MKILDPHKQYDQPKPKTKIQELLWQLDDAASSWYTTKKPEYIQEYHDLYGHLRSRGWSGTIDIDSQLPRELMPQDYLEQIAAAEAKYLAQTANSATSGAANVNDSHGE